MHFSVVHTHKHTQSHAPHDDWLDHWWKARSYQCSHFARRVTCKPLPLLRLLEPRLHQYFSRLRYCAFVHSCEAMTDHLATDSIPSNRVPLILSTNRLTESMRETSTASVQYGSGDSISRERAFTEAVGKSPVFLEPPGFRKRGKYNAQDESGTVIRPPEQLTDQSTFGEILLGNALKIRSSDS